MCLITQRAGLPQVVRGWVLEYPARGHFSKKLDEEGRSCQAHAINETSLVERTVCQFDEAVADRLDGGNGGAVAVWLALVANVMGERGGGG